jgi:predicted DNA-binding transcriptional regulator YafY
MRTGEKDFLEFIDERILVLKAKPVMEPVRDLDLIQTLLKSIAESRVTGLKYFTHYRQESTQRNVEPLVVFYLDNFWHLIAYCRLRKDYRDFRLDRIESLSVSGEIFDRRHPSLKEYLSQIYKDRDLHRVVIRVKKDVAHYLDGQKYYNGFISQIERGDEVEMDFLCPSLHGFARWYLMFADRARIAKPEALKEKVKEIVAAIGEVI